MQTQPAIHYNNRGYEATYNPASDACVVTVRGFKTVDGRYVERGWPTNPGDRPLAKFTLSTSCATLVAEHSQSAVLKSLAPTSLSPRVVDTFHDALLDRRDLLGAPLFRHKPDGDVERRYFAAAYDAAQKVRSNSTILGVGKLLFSLSPSLFAIVDCFSRDKSGAFWLMVAETPNPRARFEAARSPVHSVLPLAAYVLEVGEYVPANATVRLGVWSLLPVGPSFVEVPNNRIAARDAVISHLLATPF